MPSTRRVKVLAVALAIAVCTILYISVRLALPILQLYSALGEKFANLCARMFRTTPHPKTFTVALLPPLIKSKRRTKK